VQLLERATQLATLADRFGRVGEQGPYFYGAKTS
jgi:hypothetical protein